MQFSFIGVYLYLMILLIVRRSRLLFSQTKKPSFTSTQRVKPFGMT
jgi:hypothetical protein